MYLEGKFLIQWKNDTYALWEHFLRDDEFIAHCQLCGNSLKYACRQDIEKHMNRNHKEEVAKIREKIACSWLSRHFKFTNHLAICQLGCLPKYRAKIFQGLDFLTSHLAIHHNTKEYSICEGRTGDNNADGMTQQSVDERNYAGPSSRYDNTHPQSLGNQEDQQGSNVGNSGQSSSGQQGSKIYNSLSEFINDLPDEILMQYQEKQ